jgi:hypothetical protein
MPFDWMHPKRVKLEGRFTKQFVGEIKERARLLRNLNFSKKEATKRIQAALRWEFDKEVMSTPMPKFYKDVPKLVKEIYGK